MPLSVTKAGTVKLLPSICTPHTPAGEFCFHLELEGEPRIRVKVVALTYSPVGGLGGDQDSSFARRWEYKEVGRSLDRT